MKEISSYQELKSLVQVSEANGKHVVVEFYASWCGACRAMAPIYHGLERRYPTLVFAKADVDKSKELSKMAGIHSMPTIQMFVRGTRVEEVVGVNEQNLVAMLEKYK